MPIYWTLKAALKRAALSPGAAATLGGLHRQSLYAILRTEENRTPVARVEAETLDGLCKALDCQPGDLLTRKAR